MSLEAFEAAGLYDPAAPRATERAELIAHLVGRFGEAPVLQAAARAPLYTVAVELTDPPPVLMSACEVAAATGLSPEDVAVVRAAAGSPVEDVDQRSIPETAVEDVLAFTAAVELFGRDATLAFIRVLGGVSQQVADAARALFATSVVAESGPGTVTELELSQANEVAWAAYGSIPVVLGHLLLERADNRQDLISRIVDGDLRLAVVFVDLVGSTAWAADVEPVRYATALAEFEQAAWETTVTNRARLVKLIGDEAMVVADDVATACRIACQLCAHATAHPDLPAARGAVGYGEVTTRGGDYFGAIVNLVARAVREAPPGQVVVAGDAAGHLAGDPGWTLAPLGPASLRGVAEPVELSLVSVTST